MKYFRLAYKDNATSTTHVEDVRAVSAEEAAAISRRSNIENTAGCGVGRH